VRALLDHPALARHLGPEHHALRRRAREIFEGADLDEWTRGRGSADGYLSKETWAELGRAGLVGVSLPAELGGGGLGLAGSLVLSEAISYLGDLGPSLGLHCQSDISGQWLATAHEDAVRDRYLPEMIAGRLVGCAADTEPENGMESRAEADGGEVVVHARKLYVVNGANADLCFVTCKLDGESTTVLIEKDRPGVSVPRVFDKLGTRAIDSAELLFDGVRVPAENVSTKRGVRQLMHWNKVMTSARFLMAADACLIHARLLDAVLPFAAGRVVAGRPLADWPINRSALAGAVADQALMQAGLVDAFERLSSGANSVAEVAGLKWLCVDRACRFAAFCAELHGGAGYMWTSGYLRALAQVLGLKMAGGSSTTMKTIAGQAMAYREELEALE
jgi:alkylation response protein AidB-like acyl-CoA dehydrogenase